MSEEMSIRYKGWTIEERVWAIHWVVTGIWVTQLASTLAVLLMLAQR